MKRRKPSQITRNKVEKKTKNDICRQIAPEKGSLFLFWKDLEQKSKKGLKYRHIYAKIVDCHANANC